nr:hypothetical protein [uncultured Treponema sp.]
MKKTLINQIQTEMSGVLNNAQRQKLCDVLEHCFFYVEVVSLIFIKALKCKVFIFNFR